MDAQDQRQLFIDGLAKALLATAEAAEFDDESCDLSEHISNNSHA